MKKKLMSSLLMGAMVLSMTACSSNTKPNTEVENEVTATPESTNLNVTVTEIRDAVKKAYGENYFANVAHDEEYIKEVYGLNPEWYEEVISEGPMISVNVDTFVAVKAKKGQEELVEKALTDYRTSLIEDTMQYPMNVPKIQASKVHRVGNYVCFVMLGTVPMEVQEQGDEAMLKEYQKQTEQAIKAIDDVMYGLK